MPSEQFVHAVALLAPVTDEYAPDRHKTHALALLEPVTVEYVPAGHCTHVLEFVAPATPENAPGGQFTHRLPLKYLPAAHTMPTHTPSALAPTVLDALPTPQAVHALAPAPAYVPARQSTHALTLLAPFTPELLPAAQLMHALALVAATTPEYAPTEQSIHDALPVTFLNVPATQAVQTPPSGPVYPVLHLQSEIVLGDVENGDCDDIGHDAHEEIPE